MRLFLLLIAFSLAAFFLEACFSEENISDSDKESTRTQEIGSTFQKKNKEDGVSGPDAEGVIFDNLQEKYKAKGFESFCVLKADLDSMYLIANYMAQVIYGKDNFNPARISFAEWIEKDRRIAYYRSHNLNSDEVDRDLLEYAKSKTTFCKSYLEFRYQLDQDEINKVLHLRLAKEARQRYTP